jgi:predicted DNA-binding protein YlxM (UPF0122 family)
MESDPYYSEDALVPESHLADFIKSDAHYMLKCYYLADYAKTFDLSERKLAAEFEISKSEVHRMLIVARTPDTLWEAVEKFKTDFYALYLYNCPKHEDKRSELYDHLKSGKIRSYTEAKIFLKEGRLVRLQED